MQADAAALVVPGDERLLRRALRNLLENARRYGGGEITLQRERAAGRGRVELRVCDRGPGVPEALRERIFEPFFRLPGHAEREGGVGLGLALVRRSPSATAAACAARRARAAAAASCSACRRLSRRQRARSLPLPQHPGQEAASAPTPASTRPAVRRDPEAAARPAAPRGTSPPTLNAST